MNSLSHWIPGQARNDTKEQDIILVMHLRTLHLKRFRSYEDSAFEFSDGVNMVVGPNGTGKTNLLEAIYVAMRGVSFRVADKDLPKYESDWFRIDAEFDAQTRSIRYQQPDSPSKQVVINDGARKRFTRTLRLPVVLFEPDMLRSLSGSPARRRRLLDELVSQWFDDGATTLRRYERVLLQRNNILKDAYQLPQDKLEDQLFAWDMSFAELADKIEAYRREVMTRLNRSLADIYNQIAKKSHTVEARYHGASHPDKQHILHALRQHRRLDVARGYTTIGPHRSDFSLHLDGQPADITASRGEQRSLVLAIKQIEATELAIFHETAPILLLDDITGELDPQRVKSLLELVKPYQTIASAAHHTALLDRAAHRHIDL